MKRKGGNGGGRTTKKPRYRSGLNNKRRKQVHSNNAYRSRADNTAYKKVGKQTLRSKSKKRPLKLKPQMAKAIKKVFEATKPYGVYTSVLDAAIPPLADNTKNTQGCVNLETIYRPADFIEATAVLFQGSTPILAPTPAQASTSFNDWRAAKFHCRRAVYTYEIKNVSNRTYFVNLWQARCKMLDNTDSAVDWWTATLLQNGTTSKVNAINQGTTGLNPLNMTRFTLYNKPTDWEMWRSRWKGTSSSATIEPGETTVFTVLGPIDKTFKGSKLGDGTSATQQQIRGQDSNTVNVFLTYYVDLVKYLDTGVVYSGRAQGTTSEAEMGGLAIQRKATYVMSCPDIVGEKLIFTPVAGDVVNNNLVRGPVIATKVWEVTALSSGVRDVNEDDPNTIFNPAG